MKKITFFFTFVITFVLFFRTHAQCVLPPNIDAPSENYLGNMGDLLDELINLGNLVNPALERSTSSFSNDYTTAAIGSGSFYGAFFTTGSAFEFVDVWDSSSVALTPNLTPIRIHNSYHIITDTISAGFSGPPHPYRYKNGLIWKPNVNSYNQIDLLYVPD